MASRKDKAQQAFKQLEIKLDCNLAGIVDSANYQDIIELNEANNSIFQKYSKQDNVEEIGYDMTTFKQDTSNTGKLLGAVHKMTLQGYESKRFKFNWTKIATAMKNINNLDSSTEMKNVSKNQWLNCYYKTGIYTGFPSFGFSSTVFNSNQALTASLALKEKPKIKKLPGEKSKENEQAKKRAEKLILENADERAQVQEDYDQNDGQISTKVLQKTLDTILIEMDKRETDRLEYIKTIIDPNSFGHTVENMFHISFLIRDSKLGIELDKHDIPHLVKVNYGAPDKKKQKVDENFNKPNQGITTLTMDLWKQFTEKLDLKKEKNIFHRS